ncbi:MAG: RBBP9/YdeN family alpha/beta hydrolase [Limnohabitans sp.]|jgi:predicted alpha/beta hydrolase family esterase
MSATVLILPGWQGSGPEHWQMHWVRRRGYTVVEQNDWLRPRRGDWLARLDETVVDTPGPLVLVAHSLGCIQVAAWAAFSSHTARVQGALLVAPGDVETAEMKEQLPGWQPIVRQPLPFRSILVGSQNDPYCREERAQALARDWGAQWVSLGAAGHINADTALGDWPEGHALLQTLLKE